MSDSETAYRLERDPVGEKRVPAEALYGVQTARAQENFRISGLRVHPLLITAYAEVKKAAAFANQKTGRNPEGVFAARPHVVRGAGEG